MKTFCITLPETPERTAEARVHFEHYDVDAEFYTGIHAATFGLFTTHPYLHDDPKRGGHIIPQRQVGCTLSHISLWSALTLIEQEHQFFILEDDAEFHAGWQDQLAAALRDTPADADMLYVGSCCCADKPQTHVKGNVWDVRWPLCNHSYVVWAKALPTLLATQRDVYAPIDIALYFKTLPQLRVYTVLPRLISQRGTPLHP